MYIQRKRWRMNRRTFLGSAAVSLGLPWLEAMGAQSVSVSNAGVMTSAEVPRRVYFSSWGFFNPDSGIPKLAGLNYPLTPTLSPLEPYKKDFTLFSQMKAFSGGHFAESCLLTGMNTFTNSVKLVSVDQQIADFFRGQTRVPSLVLSNTRKAVLSWTPNKTPITPECSPQALFDRLFLKEDEKTKEANLKRMNEEKSILDWVGGQAEQLKTKLGKDDRATLDQYFTSIREVEERINLDKRWLDKDKPKVDPLKIDNGPIEKRAMANDDGTGMRTYLHLMFDLVVLAFQTDSTRVVAHDPKGEDGPVFKEKTQCPVNYHELSHSAGEADKLKWYQMVDQCYIEFWAYFLKKLKETPEGKNGTLLDHTMAAWATTNGGAGGHANTLLPVMLCGGSKLGLKHQGHLVKKDVMIYDVWRTMVQCIGMKVPENFQGNQSKKVIAEVIAS
jgi:hypothetical protein